MTNGVGPQHTFSFMNERGLGLAGSVSRSGRLLLELSLLDLAPSPSATWANSDVLLSCWFPLGKGVGSIWGKSVFRV